MLSMRFSKLVDFFLCGLNDPLKVSWNETEKKTRRNSSSTRTRKPSSERAIKENRLTRLYEKRNKKKKTHNYHENCFGIQKRENYKTIELFCVGGNVQMRKQIHKQYN